MTSDRTPPYEPAGADHFYSPQTRVSLELPAGDWRHTGGDGSQAVYTCVAEPQDGPAGHPPRLIVRAIPVAADRSAAFAEMAAAMAARHPGEGESGTPAPCTVDGAPGVGYVARFAGEDGAGVTQHQTFAQLANVVWSITGMVEQRSEEAFLPVFEAAAASIRFILD